MADAAFVVFAIVFGVTRIVIYPNWILRSVIVDVTKIFGFFCPGQVFYILLLGALQLLHIFWFSIIVKMA